MNHNAERRFSAMIRGGLLGMLWLLGLSPFLSADDKLTSRRAVKPAATSISHGDRVVLRFKVSPSVDSQVVRLEDLVEVVSWGSRAKEDLLSFPLGPAPQVGKTQDWTASDLIRNLEFRGMDKSKIAWQGPESVRLLRNRATESPVKPASAERKKLAPAFLNDRIISQAESNLIQATREYLWLQTNERTQWRIGLKVPTELAGALAQRRNILSIGGGAEPWTGRQRLVYLVQDQDEELELTMTVNVELPTTVVVASRAIRRDEVIDESCLSYAALPERMEGQLDQYFDDMTELVGKQMRRAISTGVPIPRASIGQPNVISSGEIIEIESVSGSVVVKAAAKALNGGAVGELINVELIPSRKRLVATIAGPMLARISGKATVRSEPEQTQSETSSSPRSMPKESRKLSISETGRILDVAVEGPGFLQFTNPSTEQINYTRVGNLDIDENGQLVVGPMQAGRVIEPPIIVPHDCETIVIGPAGVVQARLPGVPSLCEIGTLQIAWFPNANDLVKVDQDIYAPANPRSRAICAQPGSKGLGTLRQGYLENVHALPLHASDDSNSSQRNPKQKSGN